VATYDLLARHYDAVTGDSSTETAFIDSIIKRAHGQAVTLLEVACGTGGIIAPLAGRYRVSGLDISPGMLAVARKKLPEGTPLHLADMSCFNLNVKFDAIICVYHGINHLLDFSAWENFFGCAYRHLNDGGVLVFDTYTASSLKMMASIPGTVQRFSDNYLHIRVRTSDEVVFDWSIEVLELQPDGRYKSLTEVIRTVSFPPEKIRESLGERFINIVTIESDGGVNDDSEDRTWFVCSKPGGRFLMIRAIARPSGQRQKSAGHNSGPDKIAPLKPTGTTRRPSPDLTGLQRLLAANHHARINLLLPDGPLTGTKLGDLPADSGRLPTVPTRWTAIQQIILLGTNEREAGRTPSGCLQQPCPCGWRRISADFHAGG